VITGWKRSLKFSRGCFCFFLPFFVAIWSLLSFFFKIDFKDLRRIWFPLHDHLFLRAFCWRSQAQTSTAAGFSSSLTVWFMPKFWKRASLSSVESGSFQTAFVVTFQTGTLLFLLFLVLFVLFVFVAFFDPLFTAINSATPSTWWPRKRPTSSSHELQNQRKSGLTSSAPKFGPWTTLA